MKKIMGCLGIWLVLIALAFGAQNYVQETGVIQWTNPGAAVSSGDLIDLGNRYGVALVDLASNETGAVATEGVFEFLRAETTAITVDLPLYYNSATKVAVTEAAGTYVGTAIEAISSTNTVDPPYYKVSLDLNAPRAVRAEADEEFGGLADVVDNDSMADDDHGDVSWSSGVATVDAVGGTAAATIASGAALGATALQPTGLTTNQKFLSATDVTNTFAITNGVIWAVQ